ncbi:hypothetical protein BT63DRAFT_162563 [Microthyrium microscopicum]|uniref:STEEP1 domain-containing protein n=1 Tax=Microthyrium microscopicum TaxID=703497 RepID=A0A6A6UMY7_9PEZI|nr:hypothetical protein BT63DRAFT_162563 [Microthyrium microscopicum]
MFDRHFILQLSKILRPVRKLTFSPTTFTTYCSLQPGLKLSQMNESTTSPVVVYHCLCTQLLLATAKPLDSNMRRGREGLDKAYIVPLTPLKDLQRSHQNLPSDQEQDNGTSTSPADGAVLLNTLVDKKPIVVRRSDGFEPRYQRRCTRCDLVIGYHLDNTQTNPGSQAGRDDKTVFILPDALNTTEEMANPSTNSD